MPARERRASSLETVRLPGDGARESPRSGRLSPTVDGPSDTPARSATGARPTSNACVTIVKPSAALASLRHLASLGLPPQMAVPTLSLLIGDLLPISNFTIGWFDEDCELRDMYSNQLAPAEIGQRIVSEYLNAREAEAYTPHRAFMQSTSRCDLPHTEPNYYRTSFFDEIARPMDFGVMARFAVRDEGRPVAVLWLTRPVGDRDFSKRELLRMFEAVSYVEHVLLGAEQEAESESSVERDERGWLVADEHGSVQYLAEGTEALLHRAASIPRNGATMSRPYEWVRPMLRELARRVAALESGRRAATPSMTIRNGSGHYVLRAHRLDALTNRAENHVGVQISCRIPLALRLLESPRVRALPPREKQVCLSLALGRTASEIATAMGVSAHAVVQHVRSLYARFGVHRREELLPALLHPEEG